MLRKNVVNSTSIILQFLLHVPKKLKIIKNVLNYCKIRKAKEKSILNTNENNLKATLPNLSVCKSQYHSDRDQINTVTSA